MTPPFKLAAVLVILFAGLAAFSGLAVDAGSQAEDQGIYAFNGNTFIIRVMPHGQTTYLHAYRLAGDQWEPFGHASMPTPNALARKRHHGSLVERIYIQGKLIGYSRVDLDNPINTHLNRNFGGCGAC